MEPIKLINEDNIDMILSLFNQIYNSGELPEKRLRTTFIAVPKKQPKKCTDYRLISLMSHILKTFPRIIHACIRSKYKIGLRRLTIRVQEHFRYAGSSSVSTSSYRNTDRICMWTVRRRPTVCSILDSLSFSAKLV